MNETDPIKPDCELSSLGQLCAILQRSPRHVRQALERYGMPPAYRVNGVDHWDALVVEQLFAHFNGTTGGD